MQAEKQNRFPEESLTNHSNLSTYKLQESTMNGWNFKDFLFNPPKRFLWLSSYFLNIHESAIVQFTSIHDQKFVIRSSFLHMWAYTNVLNSILFNRYKNIELY